MKYNYLPAITGEDAIRFLREDAEPLGEAQKANVDRCRNKYEEYFAHKKGRNEGNEV